MKSIAIYNNKGGVGKSTVTLFLADFFSSSNITKIPARVLVIDIDGQSSATTSLVGLDRAEGMKTSKLTLSHLLLKLHQNIKVDIESCLECREETETPSRRYPLGDLWVMPIERSTAIKLEKQLSQRQVISLLKQVLQQLEPFFDLIIWDLPSNIDERNLLAMASLALSEYTLIPTEPSRLAQNALPDTFDNFKRARSIANSINKKSPKPQVVGIVLNKTDKRSQPYRRHIDELQELANQQDTVIFDAILPTATELSAATDDSMEFHALREKYGDTYYIKVRELAKELAKRCEIYIEDVE